MSIIRSEDSGKWITGLVAIFSAVLGFVTTKFLDQMVVWFDLETKIPNIALYTQLLGVLVFLLGAVYLIKNSKSSAYLNEVYDELVKVVWPSKDATIKITVGLVVALVVVAAIFVSVDFIFKKILSFVY